jgi:two-component system, OmpR family, sensor histidine kinase MtrB
MIPVAHSPAEGAPPARRWGLRVRVTVAFAVLSLVVVCALSMVTYVLAQRYLIQQRERSATRQAFLNARLVRDSLIDPAAPPGDALALLELSPRSQAAFVRDEQWYGETDVIDRETLPASFRDLVTAGNAVHQRVRLGGERRLLVGIPLPAANGVYFEAFSLQELTDTLDALRTALAIGVVLTPLAAGLLGLWASRLVLRPVGEVSTAAAQIAGGDLGARLEVSPDPDLRSVSESFNAMVDALTERMARDQRFAGDVSHELRSPLTTLSTAASVLDSKREELSPRTRRAADLVVAEIERFQELVEALLELNRMQAGAETVQAEDARLGELVLHAVARSRARDVAVRIAPELDAMLVVLDKRRVERIIVNLLDNAQEHGQGQIRLIADRLPDAVRIAVEDEGIGITTEDRERVFERFARGRRAGSRGDSLGSGLGLALVAEHVRLLRGRVWVEDRAGLPGARFVVELPAHAP